MQGLRDSLQSKCGEVRVERFDDSKFALMHVESTFFMVCHQERGKQRGEEEEERE